MAVNEYNLWFLYLNNCLQYIELAYFEMVGLHKELISFLHLH